MRPLALALVVLVGFAPASASAGTCEPAEQTPDQGHLHLVGDTEPPGEYRTTPPTSGWHHRERERVHLEVRAADAPLTEAEQVTVLAVGGVVVSYRDIRGEDLAALEQLVGEEFAGRAALTPNAGLGAGEVALTAWALLQLCHGVDLEEARTFLDTHAAAEPDFTMGAIDHTEHTAGQEEPGTPLTSWSRFGALAAVVLLGAVAAGALRRTRPDAAQSGGPGRRSAD